MIQTTRCDLMALRADDLEHVVRLYTDADVRRFLGGPVDEQTMRSRFPAILEPDTSTQRLAVRIKTDGSFAGLVTLSPHHDGVDTEVSYQFLPEWWGQGYATEAVQAVVTHALTHSGLPRVIAETQTANIASCRLLERIGMRLDRTVDRFGAEQSIYTTDAASEAF